MEGVNEKPVDTELADKDLIDRKRVGKELVDEIDFCE